MRLVELRTANFRTQPCYTLPVSDEVVAAEVLRHPECWTRSAIDGSFVPSPTAVSLFDQNGYDLTYVEQLFCRANGLHVEQHRNERHLSLRQSWLIDTDAVPQDHGKVHLNHSYLFERKGFEHQALRQLLHWIKMGATCQLHKLVHLRPKWGIDISVDYSDAQNAFEVLHFEWDSFYFDRATEVKTTVARLLTTSFTPSRWSETAAELLQTIDEWSGLSFFDQSDWKCNYFGLPKEQFKMVCWSTTDA